MGTLFVGAGAATVVYCGYREINSDKYKLKPFSLPGLSMSLSSENSNSETSTSSTSSPKITK